MTKAELIKQLEPYPDNMDIYLEVTDDEFTYAYVNGVRKEKVLFSEDADGSGETCEDEVIIISDL